MVFPDLDRVVSPPAVPYSSSTNPGYLAWPGGSIVHLDGTAWPAGLYDPGDPQWATFHDEQRDRYVELTPGEQMHPVYPSGGTPGTRGPMARLRLPTRDVTGDVTVTVRAQWMSGYFAESDLGGGAIGVSAPWSGRIGQMTDLDGGVFGNPAVRALGDRAYELTYTWADAWAVRDVVSLKAIDLPAAQHSVWQVWKVVADVAVSGGLWPLRQRQAFTRGGWPLRQRQAGRFSGSWPLRQRQSGV